MSTTAQVNLVVDLPIASSTQLGGLSVQSDSGLLVDGSGNLSVDSTQFLTTSAASSTYATQSSLSNYLTTSVAASTYATQTSLSNYALADNANLTGIPIVPTASPLTGNNQIASTEYVDAAVAAGSGGASLTGAPFFLSKENIQVIQVYTDAATVTINQDSSLVMIYSVDSGGPIEYVVFPTPLGNGHKFSIVSGISLQGYFAQSSHPVTYKSNPPNMTFSTWVYYSDESFSGGWYQTA